MKRKFDLQDEQDLLNEFIRLDSDEARTAFLMTIDKDADVFDAIFKQATKDNSPSAFEYCLNFRTLSQIVDAFDLASSENPSIIFIALQYINENFEEEFPDIILALTNKEIANDNFNFVILLIEEICLSYHDQFEEMIHDVFYNVVEKENQKAFQFFIDSPLSLGIGEAILKAAKKGQLAIIDYLIKNIKFDPADLQTLLDNALGIAATFGHLRIVQYLIEKTDANPSADGNHAINNALDKNHFNIVLYLASFPCVFESLNETYRPFLNKLKRDTNVRFYNNTDAFRASYCTFFNQDSTSLLVDDIKQYICNSAVDLIKEEMDLSTEALGFILK